jgi:superfamily II DNA helicase RecQ
MSSNTPPWEQFTIICKPEQSGKSHIMIKKINQEIHISSSGLKAIKLVVCDNKKKKLNNGRLRNRSLRDALKAFRLQQACAMGWPAFCIFPNKVLDAILLHQPQSTEALLSIKGVGPITVKKYGTGIINCCKQYARAQQEEASRSRAEHLRW